MQSYHHFGKITGYSLTKVKEHFDLFLSGLMLFSSKDSIY